MLRVVLTLGIVFGLLVLNEFLWRKMKLRGEASRKFLHIIIGTYGAFWPFYLTYNQITFIAFGAVAFIVLLHKLHLFRSFYSVKRKSWGDLIAPATIGILATLEPTKLVFTAAVLHIALADGLAALIGTKYGANNSYKVLWNRKSIVGTLTFMIISFNILVWVFVRGEVEFTPITLPILLLIPFVTAYIENIAPWGSDNFFVPLAVVALLGALQIVI